MSTVTSTATLTLNHAFLREIKEDNQELRGLLNRLHAILSSAEWPLFLREPFVRLLPRLRDQLAIHFALEESFGFFEDPLEVEPLLCGQAEELRRQHGDLYLEVCQIADDAEATRYGEASPATLADLGLKFRDFAAKLQYHEARENELLLQAFDDDLGVGD